MVSIIMPVYNAEKSLGYAIDSVIQQTCRDWELLVIDDKSTDSSLLIIEGYANKDNRIRVYSNSENLGPALTRNVGLENAKGKYVGFIDADDTYEKNFLSKMVINAEKNQTDIVWCNYITKSLIEGKGNKSFNNIPKNVIFSNNKAITFFFSNHSGIGSVCNKLYRKKFIEKHNLRFNPERTRAEDWEFNLFSFSKVDRLVLIDDYLYDYIQWNKKSIMATFRTKDFELIFRSIELLQDINTHFNLGKSHKELINLNKNHLLEMIYRGLNSIKFKIFITNLKKKKLQESLTLIDYPHLPPTYRILCFLIKNKFYYWALIFCRISKRLFHKYNLDCI